MEEVFKTDGLCMSCFKSMGAYEVCPHCGWVKGSGPKEVYHLYPGTVLNSRYIIGTAIGFGGFGITYKAWDASLEIVVAIKEYYPAELSNRVPGDSEVHLYSGEKRKMYMNGLERFLEEARNTAQFIKQPNIVDVYDFFTQNNTAYMVMEFLDGVSLKGFLEMNGGKLSYETTWEIFDPIMQALEEVHSHKIIHRDIAPDNIALTIDHGVKLFDFGAARFTKEDETQSHSIIIKPGYAPPEQYRSKSKQGPWTDVYALGATIYRCLTGVVPEESIDRLTDKDNVAMPSDLGVEMPKNAEVAVMRAMALNDGVRFRNIKEFREAFANKKAVNLPEVELRKRRWIRGIVAAVLAAVTVTAGSIFYKFANDILPVENKSSINVYVPVADVSDYMTDPYFVSLDDAALAFRNSDDYAASGCSIKMVPVAQSDYYKQMKEAKASDKAVLFRSDLAQEEGAPPQAAPLDEINDYWHFLIWDRSGCVYSKEYESLNPEMTDFYLTFDFAVAYVNPEQEFNYGLTSLDKYSSLKDFMVELKAKDGEDSGDCLPFVVDEKSENLFIAALGGYSDGKLNAEGKKILEAIKDYVKPHDEAIKTFSDGKAVTLVSGVMTERELDELMQGAYYNVAPITDNGSLKASFADAWSIDASAGENEQKLARAFLNYLVQYNSQNSLCIQRRNGLPVNKQALEQYCTEIFTKFSFFKNYEDNLEFVNVNNTESLEENSGAAAEKGND